MSASAVTEVLGVMAVEISVGVKCGMFDVWFLASVGVVVRFEENASCCLAKYLTVTQRMVNESEAIMRDALVKKRKRRESIRASMSYCQVSHYMSTVTSPFADRRRNSKDFRVPVALRKGIWVC